jgi:HSP20 family molecular chaperone IbpA
MSRKIRLTRIYSETQSIAREVGKLQFSSYHGAAATWAPDVNVFRFEDRFEICADLAGLCRDEIELTVHGNALVLQGHRRRPVPECPGGGDTCRLTLAMEIATGPFFRRIVLPQPIDPEQVTARQDNGLLWITLPLANH